MSSVLQTFMAISIIFTVAFGLLVTVYLTRPQWLGVGADAPVDTLRVQPNSISLDVVAYKSLVKERDSLKILLLKKNDSLSNVKSDYSKVTRESQTLREQLSAQDKVYMFKMDSLEKFNWTLFAKIYDKAEPKEVAKIFTELDERDAAFILKTMKPKVAAKVLENIPPETAASIMALSRTQKLK